MADADGGLTGETGENQNSNDSQAQDDGYSPELIEALRHKLGSQDNEINQLKKQTSTIDRLREAFAPSEPKQKGKWIDPILQHAIQAEREGRPMPITTEVAVEVQRLNEMLEAQERRNQQMEQQLKRVTDPSAWQDQQMFASMDDQLQRLVNNLYPGFDNKVQYDAMVQRASGYLKQLGDDPDIWKQFRNNKEAQTRLIQKVAGEFIPDRARKQMQAEYDATSPYNQRELEEAWDAAKQIPDEKLRAKTLTQLRQTIIGLNMAKRMKQAPRR